MGRALVGTFGLGRVDATELRRCGMAVRPSDSCHTLHRIGACDNVSGWRGGFLAGAATGRRLVQTGATRGTEAFVANLGILTAVLFALVIIVQGAASLILDECVR